MRMSGAHGRPLPCCWLAKELSPYRQQISPLAGRLGWPAATGEDCRKQTARHRHAPRLRRGCAIKLPFLPCKLRSCTRGKAAKGDTQVIAATDRPASSTPPPRGDPYRMAWRRLRPGFLAVAGFSAIISLLMLTGSIYMLQVYDRVLASGSVPTLVALFAIVVVLYLFLGFYDFLRVQLLSRLALRLDADLGGRAFGRWLDSGVPGAPSDAATPLRDLETLRTTIGGSAMTVVFDLPWVPLFLGVLFVLHPLLGWLTVAGAGVVAVLAWAGHRVSKGGLAQGTTEDAALRDFSDKGRRNAETIRAMGMTTHVTARWRRMQGTMLASLQSAGDPGDMLAAASRAFRMLMQSAILTLGAWLVIRGEISGGAIIAASILSGRALGPIDQVIGQWRGLGRALAAHRRLGPALAAMQDRPAAVALPAPSGRLTVTDLHKRAFPPAGRPDALLLDRVSFALEPGDGLGVIGASASGKSTLARLLTGAWLADGGEVRLDGATLDQWEPAVLGRHIGYLPQQIDLLPGSIRDNIARFDPTIDDATVIAAARMAGVHEMILSLPEGYGTRTGVTDGAIPLSGGQMQRIGLARALCGGPRLVVLDEPNSNLDLAGDAALTAAIAALRAAGTTVVVVAHRPGALMGMNKILVLEAGRVAHFGPKDTVLASLQPAVAQAPGAIARDSDRPAWQTTVRRVTTARPEPEPNVPLAVPSTPSEVGSVVPSSVPQPEPFGTGRRPGASIARLHRVPRPADETPARPRMHKDAS